MKAIDFGFKAIDGRRLAVLHRPMSKAKNLQSVVTYNL